MQHINRLMFDFLEHEISYRRNTKSFNAYRKADKQLVIEVDVAGFSKDDLSVTRSGSKIVVSGSKSDEPVEVLEFFNQGLSYRNFNDLFIVPESYVMDTVELINGVLRITLHEVSHKATITTVKPE